VEFATREIKKEQSIPRNRFRAAHDGRELMFEDGRGNAHWRRYLPIRTRSDTSQRRALPGEGPNGAAISEQRL
jgi:hypothetical protein